jgi:hypothetical protein
VCRESVTRPTPGFENAARQTPRVAAPSLVKRPRARTREMKKNLD